LGKCIISISPPHHINICTPAHHDTHVSLLPRTRVSPP
jgi:hypothetical protein